MSRVEEIVDAISRLSPEEHRRLAEWFLEREQTRWDEQLDRDSESGKLDFLFGEADEGARHILDRTREAFPRGDFGQRMNKADEEKLLGFGPDVV